MQTIGAWPTELGAFIITARAWRLRHNCIILDWSHWPDTGSCQWLEWIGARGDSLEQDCHPPSVFASKPDWEMSRWPYTADWRTHIPAYHHPHLGAGEPDRIYQLINKMLRAEHCISVNQSICLGHVYETMSADFVLRFELCVRMDVESTCAGRSVGATAS